MAEFLLAESDQSPLAAAVRAAIGAGPSERVEVTTPTFQRPASWEPAMLPPDVSDKRAWAGFTAADRDTLRAWGCRPWGQMTTEPPANGHARHADAWYFNLDDDDTNEKRPATHELWLLPAEWYDSIPNGFPVIDINGCLEQFERGKTDDDRRFGMLAYGVIVTKGTDR